MTKKNHILFLFALVLISCNPRQNKSQSPANTKEDTITGIVRFSGLYPGSMKDLKLNSTLYQIITPAKNYYLKSELDLDALNGKCITAKGDFLRQPGEFKESYDFERGLFQLDSYEIDNFQNCKYSLHQVSRVPNTKDTSYTGKIIRSKRPSPDIAYDYRIQFLEPSEVPGLAHENDNPAKSLFILPQDFEMVTLLENHIQQESTVEVFGYLTGGYVESVVMGITGVEEQ